MYMGAGGLTFGGGSGAGFTIGSKMSPAGTDTRQANRYEGQSYCPAGQQVVQQGSTPHAPKYIGGPTSTPFVYCKPIPAPAPAAPAPAPTYTTTISPTFQQAFKAAVSPVIQVTADSPGAQIGATTSQVAPGGQQAEGGSSGADIDQLLAEQRAFQDRLEARAAEQRAYERQRADEREAAAQLERDRLQSERDEAIAADQVRLPAVQPTRQFLPIASPMGPAADVVEAPPADADNTALYIAGAIAVLLVGGYAVSQQRAPRRKSK